MDSDDRDRDSTSTGSSAPGPPRPHPSRDRQQSVDDKLSLAISLVLAVLAGILGGLALQTNSLIGGLCAIGLIALALYSLAQ